MGKTAIKNARGLFASCIAAEAMMSVKELIRLESLSCSAPEWAPEEKALLERFVALAKTMPTGVLSGGQNDDLNVGNSKKMVCWRKVTHFVNYAPENISGPYRKNGGTELGIENGSDLAQEWAAVREMEAKRKEFHEVLKKAKSPGVPAYFLSSVKKFFDRNGECVFEDISPEAKAAGESMFAIWSPENGGFVGKDNRAAALSQAVFFPSSTAAKNGATRRGMDEAFVVEFKLEIAKAIAVSERSKTGALQAALSLAEERRLNEALDAAGVDRLRAKVAELEASGALAKDEPAAAKKMRV